MRRLSVGLMLFVVVLGVSGIGGVRTAAPAGQSATPVLPPAAGTPCPATTEEENEAVARRWHEEAVNNGDLAVFDVIAAPDIVHHAGSFPDAVGLDRLKAIFAALFAGFPDVVHTIDATVSAGDVVVVRWTATGTHDGEFQGLPASGKVVTWTGINIARLECGRIVESWSEVDDRGRVEQITGVISATPGT